MILATIGYSVLYIFVMWAIATTYRNGLLSMGVVRTTVNRRFVILLGLFAVWTSYLYFIGESGYLWHFGMPPRFLLLIFLPLIIILTIIFIRNRKKAIFNAIPKEKVIYFQSFRILVELLILSTYLEGVFPIETTFEGYNFEIVVAILAPIVAYLVYTKKRLSENVALAFNFLGLATLGIIIFIVITALYVPDFWGAQEPKIKEDFSHIPYLFLPGFIAPAAIFAHIFSILQIQKSKRISAEN